MSINGNRNLNGHAERFKKHELDWEEIDLLLTLAMKKMEHKEDRRGKRFWR